MNVPRRFIAVAVLTAGLLALGISSASAHHPILSGNAVCSAGNQVVTWDLQNSETVTGTNRAMYVVSSSLPAFTVGQRVEPQPLVGSTVQGSSTYPPAQTGTVTLDVHARWDQPGPQDVAASATVQLLGDCVPATTTTQPPRTTTTQAPTTTTQALTTTTTSAVIAATTTTTTPPVVQAQSLPRTGYNIVGLVALALVVIIIGFLLVMAGLRRASRAG